MTVLFFRRDSQERWQRGGNQPDGSQQVWFGCEFRIQRMLDQSPEFLRFLSESGLEIGARGQVLRGVQTSGTIAVRVNSIDMRLSKEAGDQIMVVALAPPTAEEGSIVHAP